MDKKIFIPDDVTLAKMIENSWHSCKKQAAKAGLVLSDTTLEAFAKDMFVAGYCYGHNDCLAIIRGQIDIMDITNDIFGKES